MLWLLQILKDLFFRIKFDIFERELSKMAKNILKEIFEMKMFGSKV